MPNDFNLDSFDDYDYDWDDDYFFFGDGEPDLGDEWHWED